MIPVALAKGMAQKIFSLSYAMDGCKHDRKREYFPILCNPVLASYPLRRVGWRLAITVLKAVTFIVLMIVADSSGRAIAQSSNGRINIAPPPMVGDVLAVPSTRLIEQAPPDLRGTALTVQSSVAEYKPPSVMLVRLSEHLEIWTPIIVGVFVVFGLLRLLSALKPKVEQTGIGKMMSPEDYAYITTQMERASLKRGIQLTPIDFRHFETIIRAIQDAYSREDPIDLSRAASVKLCMNIEAHQVGNKAEGLIERITNVKILNQKLVKSWSDAGLDFADIETRVSLTNILYDRETNHIVDGNEDIVQTIKQVWTFQRRPNGKWVADNIQEVD